VSPPRHRFWFSMAKQHSVESGQRYQEVGSGYLGKAPQVWVVEDTFTNAADRLRYARLACEGDASMRKTLSIAVLTDRRRYSRILESG
jgi:hypothetical protein